MNQKTKKLLIPWIVFQIMLLVFFLISALSQYRNRFQEHIFTPASGVYYFTMGNYDSDQNAYCVDETSGTAGIFTCGPYMTMKKAENVKEFVERIDATKKINPKDLSSDQDLTIAIMNLISSRGTFGIFS